jgi:phenylalanyl-tRNA synthetase alpha chain
MLDKINEIVSEIKSYTVSKSDELEQFRLKYLSRKGSISELFEKLKSLSSEEKKTVGKHLNDLKNLAQNFFDSEKTRIESSSQTQVEEIDLSLPGRTFSTGRLHIITQTLNDFVKIFREIGFNIAEGPEIEEGFYNFDALNTPKHHPSRDIQDTYYIVNKFDNSKEYLLRTHTSPVQVRTMLNNKPPIRIISPGKVFRNETVTPKNYFTFHQVEGLYVDKNVSMKDLKAVLDYFVKKYYGSEIKTRFRPSYFPFTEPSAETDLTCILCKGKGCRTCKNTGWLELGGCGMVHPNVFEAVGYDPDVYSGYAFGWGVERIAMMKYKIHDIRILYQNDIRFLDQF